MKKDTLLIIDDMPDNVIVLVEFLRHAGFDVLFAYEGPEGIEIAKISLPDLILLDIMMPDMDGFQVCKALKAQEPTQHIPIIFMTALTDTINKIKGFTLGAADYITKPIQYEEVLARINTHLKIRKQQHHIQQQNQQLQATNAELDAFAHMVAHDLKNPLNGIIALSELLMHEEHQIPIQTRQQHLHMIHRAGQQMSSIISSLLTLAGVSQQLKITYQPLDMQSILQQIIQHRLAYMIQEYQATICLPTRWPPVIGYSPWVEEIWANYLINGLKYGGCPPHLELGAEMGIRDNQVRFWVKDNGRGLNEQDKSRLFKAFSRLNTQKVEGHGLGLSIVRRITEKLGGEVGVESAPNQGSLFYFTLPIAPSKP